MGKLSEDDKELIKKAKILVSKKKVFRGVIKEVGCALVSKDGKIYSGVSIDLACGIGFCAEHSAIASMISGGNETKIGVIVASNSRGIIYPCGRCRELIRLIDRENYEDTEVIISENEKVKLKELLPGSWI